MKYRYAALLVAGTALAQSPGPQSAAQEDDELSEVLVTAQRPVRDRGSIDGWLRRLIGKYRNTGTVSSLNGPLDTVTGTTECEGVGVGAGVRCMVTLRTPTYETSFNPGALLLGLEIKDPKVRFMTVDDKGYGASDSSDLRGDSVRFRTTCKVVDVRDCFANTMITVGSRSDDVHFQVDIELEGIQTTHFDVTWKRGK